MSGGDSWGLPLWSRLGSRAPCGPVARDPASLVWGSRLACRQLLVPSECPPVQASVCSSVEERAWASHVALVAKNPPASAGDTGDAVRSLGQEDLLEEGLATRSSVLARRIPWTEEPGGPQSPHIGWDATEAAAPACVEERAGTEVSGLLGSHFGSDAASLI